jgi:hypothetical protein
MHLAGNNGIFSDDDATQHFVSTLHHKESSVQALPGIYSNEEIGAETYAKFNNSFSRNRQLNLVKLLLAPPPQQQPQQHPQPQQQRQPQPGSSTTMILKISQQAITKFAKVCSSNINDAAGASAIFKLFQARPAILEKRPKGPATAAERRLL